MKFVEVEEGQVPERRRTTRKIIREFLESGVRMAKLDLNDPDLKDRGLTSVYVSLKMALKGSNDPIRVIQSKGEIYLKRKDVGEEALKQG